MHDGSGLAFYHRSLGLDPALLFTQTHMSWAKFGPIAHINNCVSVSRGGVNAMEPFSLVWRALQRVYEAHRAQLCVNIHFNV